MNSFDSQLDSALIWDDAGHLSERAVNALVDGELGVVPGAAEHTERCEQCADRVGVAALFALEIADSIPPPPIAHAREASAPKRKTVPVIPIALASSVALLAISPRAAALVMRVSDFPRLCEKALPLVTEIARIFSGAAQSSSLHELGWIAALLLASFGAAVARFAPRHTARRSSR